MPSYKLIYFDGRGRGEGIRMLLTLAGQEFEDSRFTEGEWPSIKGNQETFPLGQVPVLLIDGKPMPQSRAICQYLAREFGFYGKNNQEATQIDVIYDTAVDLKNPLVQIIYAEKDEAKQAEGLTKYREEGCRKYLSFLTKLFKEGGGRFFVGESETLADVSVYNILDDISEHVGATFVADNYPELAQFRKGITDNSKLSEYIKNRP